MLCHVISFRTFHQPFIFYQIISGKESYLNLCSIQLTVKQGFLYTGHKAILKKQGIRKGEIMRKTEQIYVVMAVFIVSLFVIQTFVFATSVSSGDTQYAEKVMISQSRRSINYTQWIW